MSSTERTTDGSRLQAYLRAEYRRRAEWHFGIAVDVLYDYGDLATAVRNYDAAALNYRLAGMQSKSDLCRDRAEMYQLDIEEMRDPKAYDLD